MVNVYKNRLIIIVVEFVTGVSFMEQKEKTFFGDKILKFLIPDSKL